MLIICFDVGSKLQKVATFSEETDLLSITDDCKDCAPIEWELGKVPLDETLKVLYQKKVSLSAVFILSVISISCIILSLALLGFNIYYRKLKYAFIFFILLDDVTEVMI